VRTHVVPGYFVTKHGVTNRPNQTARSAGLMGTDPFADIADALPNGESLAALPAFTGILRLKHGARSREKLW